MQQRGEQQAAQPQPAAAAAAAAALEQPPEVPLSTQFPVEGMLGAVDAIREHHEKEAEEHRRLGQQQQQEGRPAGEQQQQQQGHVQGGLAAGADGAAAAQPSAAAAAAAAQGSDGGGDGEGGNGGGGEDGEKPLGYPGTFFLAEPLTGEAAHTLTRMWQPPPGGQYPGYPGYPPAGGPPAQQQYPGYPPAGGPPAQQQYPGYPPAGGLPAQQQYPGYPPVGAPAGPASSAYPLVHHSSPAAAPARDSTYPSAPPYQPAPLQQPGQAPGYSAVPPSVPPAGGSGGRKKAFIVGINYFGTSAQLRGCINDAKCMEYLLKSKFGFKQEHILMMTDDCPDPLRRPTKANMLQGFRWLMMDLKEGDSLIFHYSGHGSQQRDYSGEETDGMNETLCPMDFKMAGEIVDDDLNRILVNPLPKGVKLHCIIDACHSGSVMDLPYQAHVRGGYAQWEATYHYTRTHKGTAGGFAVQFGASKDSQTAADTQALSGNASTGAATFCFIQAIERRGTKLTYGELLIAMHNTLQEKMGPAAQGPPMGGSSGGLMSMLLGGSMLGGGGSGYRGQEPVMSANYAFDMAFPFSL